MNQQESVLLLAQWENLKFKMGDIVDRRSIDLDHPALRLFSEPTCAISQMTLINGEKILVRDDYNSGSDYGSGEDFIGSDVFKTDTEAAEAEAFSTCGEMTNLQVLLHQHQQEGDAGGGGTY